MEAGSDQLNTLCNAVLAACTLTLSSTGRSTMNPAPRNEPRMLPTPPMMIMNRMRNERSRVKPSGSTVPR